MSRGRVVAAPAGERTLVRSGASDGAGAPIVVSNRLPYDLGASPTSARRNVGGLVNALEPIFAARPGGLWIGWDGRTLPNARSVEQALRQARAMSLPSGVTLCGVPLSERDIARYYNGLCNRALWPVLHDFPGRGVFDGDDWERYVRVNRRFADVVLARAKPSDRIWVHDYQLMLVPRFLRDGGFAGRIDFFLHTPFPPPEIFRVLPWRREILEGVLASDAVAFHTPRYRDNFVDSAETLIGAAPSRGVAPDRVDLIVGTARVHAAAIPIGIDVEGFQSLARSPAVQARARRIRAAHGDRSIVFGAERLDYTKGIVERLLAVERLLRAHPSLSESFAVVQVVVPSRHAVEEYRRMKRDIDREVGRINGELGVDGWEPIHYRYRALDRGELVAHYLAASVALVTPLRDGMNLVASEFVASRVDEGGVLVLSEFAGVSDILDGAVRVNPNDSQALAAAIHAALLMPVRERTARMRRLRPAVLANPATAWAARCLAVGTRPLGRLAAVPARGAGGPRNAT